jgi:hypothetical protein
MAHDHPFAPAPAQPPSSARRALSERDADGACDPSPADFEPSPQNALDPADAGSFVDYGPDQALPDRAVKGRGAVSNATGRYEPETRIRADDGWDIARRQA